MITYLREHKRDLALLLLLCLVIIMPGISNLPLFDPDEPVYALTPQEMISSGDWLSPQIYGQYWYDKPPLFYWLVAVCFKLFGHNEFAARFPSAFLGMITVFMVYYFVGVKTNRRIALLSAVVLLTSLEFFYLCKAAVIDITLVFCMTGALLCYWSGRYFWLYVFAGLAVIAKGPIGFLLPGAIIFLDVLFNNRWFELKKMRLFSGIIVFILIASPWYLAMWKVHGQAFIDGFLGANNLQRFLIAEHPGGEKYWWFVPVLLIGMFPWTSVLLQSVYETAKDAINKWRSRKNSNPELFMHFWAWTIFAFFSISQTKLVTYILPMFPAIAIIIALYLDKYIEKLGIKTKIAMTIISVVFALLLAVAAIFGQAILQSGVMARDDVSTQQIISAIIMQIQQPWLIWRALVTALGTLLVFGVANYKTWSKSVISGLKWQVAGLAIFSLLLVYVLAPVAYNMFDCRDFAPQFMKIYDGKSQVYIVKYRHPGFTFYTGITGVELKSLRQTETSIQNNAGSKAYYVVLDSYYNSMSEKTKKLVNIEKIFYEKYVLRVK
ncbi:MAG: glycosyltransferase family 39 protein [Negativicutes bacterium]|jgi:4-amino-4-deoxy-L-arabinose transferase-like glycosyltransferase